MSDELIDHVITTIKNEANNNPPPQKGTVTRAYDTQHVDIRLENMELIQYVPCICGKTVGADAIVIYVDGEKPFAIVDR